MRGKIDANFVDLGDKDLKNIARPVRVYAVKIGSESEPPARPTRRSRRISPSWSCLRDCQISIQRQRPAAQLASGAISVGDGVVHRLGRTRVVALGEPIDTRGHALTLAGGTKSPCRHCERIVGFPDQLHELGPAPVVRATPPVVAIDAGPGDGGREAGGAIATPPTRSTTPRFAAQRGHNVRKASGPGRCSSASNPNTTPQRKLKI